MTRHTAAPRTLTTMIIEGLILTGPREADEGEEVGEEEKEEEVKEGEEVR